MDLASEDTGALSYVRRKAGAGVVGAGCIETDLLPKDKAREAFLRVAGELLPVFRCINTLQRNLHLPIARNEKRQAVPITHAHNPARDRLPHGGVSEGHDPEEQWQPEADELEWAGTISEPFTVSAPDSSAFGPLVGRRIRDRSEGCS